MRSSIFVVRWLSFASSWGSAIVVDLSWLCNGGLELSQGRFEFRNGMGSCGALMLHFGSLAMQLADVQWMV